MSTIHGNQIRTGTVPNSALTTDPLARTNHTGTQAQSTVTNLVSDLASKVNTSSVGQPNGVASLDGSGKVPASQLSVAGLHYAGTWNASTNTPSLVSSVGTAGYYYIVSVGNPTMNLDGILEVASGDWVIFSDTGVWQKIDTTDQVASVFGRSGSVTAQAGDYTATQITNTPAGNIAATTVQTALNELDTEKVAIADINVFEAPAGAVNGANTVYVSAYTLTAGRYLVMRNGVIQEISEDVSLSGGNTITFATAPMSGDKIRIFHIS